MTTKLFLKSIGIWVLCIFYLSACTTQLTPRYDQALFTGVTQTNVKALELFAAVSAGTDMLNCGSRAQHFNQVIGNLDALSLQSKARPVPKNSVTEEVNAFLASKGVGSLAEDIAPSAVSLEHASSIIAKMKEVDCKTGLKPGAVMAFRNAFIISMDQAITYESFLAQ
ncbi:hypothetical protein [Glaciecola sp. 1036]|uniref:hypothetical protein n=1 Tax=Alteromonadaceae TaxID=72275 RepID=UPI003D040B78